MNIPLLADKSATIAKAYGVLNEETGIPFRGLFIIDENGVLRQVTINDLPVGRSVDETLRLVQAFQFTDKNGEGKMAMIDIIEARASSAPRYTSRTKEQKKKRFRIVSLYPRILFDFSLITFAKV